jgi:hypothetical protein
LFSWTYQAGLVVVPVAFLVEVVVGRNVVVVVVVPLEAAGVIIEVAGVVPVGVAAVVAVVAATVVLVSPAGINAVQVAVVRLVVTAAIVGVAAVVGVPPVVTSVGVTDVDVQPADADVNALSLRLARGRCGQHNRGANRKCHETCHCLKLP